MMKKILWLLVFLLPVLDFAEDVCPLCGGTSDQCLTDDIGAVYCSGTLVSYPAEQTVSFYDVREGTVMIGEGAFRDCTSLQTILLPDSLLVIGDSAFCNCQELTDVALPPHLYAIGPYAFVDCRKLTNIDIPETVRYIGSEAFCYTGLTEIWWRPVFFETGFCVFDPDELYSKAQPKTVHVSEVLLEYEIGDIANFCAEYEERYGITFVMDIPYGWD